MEHPFDHLAKGLAGGGGISRRQALRSLVGGLAGAMLTSMGLGSARGDPPTGGSGARGLFCVRCCEDVFGFPRPRNFSPPFTPFGQCVVGCLRNIPAVCLRRVCPSRISSHMAVCAPGSACCNGECRDLRTDPRNCGACGKVCTIPGDICAGQGRCCPGDAPILCGGFCYPNVPGLRCCGPGFPRCPIGQKCCNGACIPGSSTCCTGGGSCPSTAPFCRDGLCCTQATGGECFIQIRVRSSVAAA
jgi:hypothetical protein